MTNAWAQRWNDLLDDGNGQVVRRLYQGRNLLRAGRVTGVQIGRGVVTASVQGFSATPMVVEITLPVLDDRQWEVVIDALASQVRHRARLLAGQVPDGLEAQLQAHGLTLFPRRDQLDVTCRCGDDVVPCMHAAGAWLAAGDDIDDDPFLLLRALGRGRERLLAESAAVRSGGADPAAPLRRSVDSLQGEDWIHTHVDLEELVQAVPEPPRTVAGPLRLLGDPPGWAGGVSAGDLFAPLVQRGAIFAQALLDGEPPPDAGPPE
jgi:uncharacterized Zn finger protein